MIKIRVEENYGSLSLKRFCSALGELVAEFLYDLGYDTSFTTTNDDIIWTVLLDPSETDVRDFILPYEEVSPIDNIRPLVKSFANKIRNIVDSSTSTTPVVLESKDRFNHIHESHKTRKNKLYIRKTHKHSDKIFKY